MPDGGLDHQHLGRREEDGTGVLDQLGQSGSLIPVFGPEMNGRLETVLANFHGGNLIVVYVMAQVFSFDCKNASIRVGLTLTPPRGSTTGFST